MHCTGHGLCLLYSISFSHLNLRKQIYLRTNGCLHLCQPFRQYSQFFKLVHFSFLFMFCINNSDALRLLTTFLLIFLSKKILLVHRLPLRHIEDIDTYFSSATCSDMRVLEQGQAVSLQSLTESSSFGAEPHSASACLLCKGVTFLSQTTLCV